MEAVGWFLILVAVAGVAVGPAFPTVRRWLGIAEDSPDAKAVRNLLAGGRGRRWGVGESVLTATLEPLVYPQQTVAGDADDPTGLATDLEMLERDGMRFAALGDRWSEANALNLIGFIHERSGRFGAAYELHSRALRLFREVEDQAGIGDTLNNLGVVLGRLGEARQARRFHEKALSVRRGSDDRASNSYNNLGVVVARSQHDLAKRFLGEAEVLAEKSGDKRGLGKTINNSAALDIAEFAEESESDLICARFRHSLDLRDASADQRGNAKTTNNLGIVLALRGEYDAAELHFADAAAMAGGVEDHIGLLHMLRNWLRLVEFRGERQEILGSLEKRMAKLSAQIRVVDRHVLEADCEALAIEVPTARFTQPQVALLSSGSATPATAATLATRLEHHADCG